jgi:hypothetical protein
MGIIWVGKIAYDGYWFGTVAIDILLPFQGRVDEI